MDRRGIELAIDYPAALPRRHCEELADGLARPQSTVFEIFADTHTISALEDRGLWGRMDIAVDVWGWDNVAVGR